MKITAAAAFLCWSTVSHSSAWGFQPPRSQSMHKTTLSSSTIGSNNEEDGNNPMKKPTPVNTASPKKRQPIKTAPATTMTSAATPTTAAAATTTSIPTSKAPPAAAAAAAATTSTSIPTSKAPAAATTTTTTTPMETSSPAAASTPPPPAFEEVKIPDLPTALQDLQLPAMVSKTLQQLNLQQLPDANTLLSSLQDGGDVGTRGELVVAGQALLILAVALGGDTIPLVDGVRSVLGPVLLLAGVGGMVVSVSALGANGAMSPFTTPNTKSEGVVATGLYDYVRHPLYTALLMSCTGWSLVTDSASRLVLTGLLFGLLNVKTEQEEENMVNKFPEYADYKNKVTGKFFPVEFVEETKSNFLSK